MQKNLALLELTRLIRVKPENRFRPLLHSTFFNYWMIPRDCWLDMMACWLQEAVYIQDSESRRTELIDQVFTWSCSETATAYPTRAALRKRRRQLPAPLDARVVPA